jgi:hypothetical protein
MMEIGFKKLGDEWRWKGRRYVGGLLHGLAIGTLLGGILIGKHDIIDRWPAAFPLSFLGYFLLVWAGHKLVGKPDNRTKREG